MKNVIYALRDPRDGFYRYIGKSSKGLRRARAHACKSKRKENKKKTAWVNELQSEGLTYEIIILEEVTQSVLNEREVWWISFYRPFGMLFNVSNGGTYEADAQAGGFASWAGLTPEQRKERARRADAHENVKLAIRAAKACRTIEQQRRLSSLGGRTGAGGRGRMASLSPTQRSELGQKAIKARWSNTTTAQRREHALLRESKMTAKQKEMRAKKGWETRRSFLEEG